MKIVPFLVAAALALVLAGCGNEKPEKTSGGAAATSTAQSGGHDKPDGGTAAPAAGPGGW